MKRLLAVAALGLATILVGACASQGPSYYGGGGGFGYGGYLDDRYYDCYDGYGSSRYNCGYPNYYDRNPAAAPQRMDIIAGPVHRPITRVIERPVDNGSPTHSASRSFSRPRADVSVDSSSSGGVSGSSGMSGGAPSSPPPPPPAPSFSAPAPSRAPEPVTVQRSPQ